MHLGHAGPYRISLRTVECERLRIGAVGVIGDDSIAEHAVECGGLGRPDTPSIYKDADMDGVSFRSIGAEGSGNLRSSRRRFLGWSVCPGSVGKGRAP